MAAAAALTQYHFLRRFHPYLIPQAPATTSSLTNRSEDKASSAKSETTTEKSVTSS